MSLNNVCIMGRLTRAPELRRTPNGTAVASFTLAVDRDIKGDEKKTDFIDCVAWKGTAEFVSSYFDKGRMAVVTGRIQSRNWEDNNGNKRTRVEVIADRVYFGDNKTNNSTPNKGYTQLEKAITGDFAASYEEIDDEEELPF